ncbi:MAG: Lrp/AsnC family transcriptional regulator [Bacillota bacterium]
MGKAGLTERRKQFLQKLLDLYRRTNLPVHYESVARALGVSKWTAYDMLKELEKLGYLRRDYAVGRGGVGRSLIVFTPTSEAERLFARTRVSLAGPEEWETVKAQVTGVLRQLRGMHPGEAIQKLLQDLPHVESRVTFCAHLLGFLILYVLGLGERTAQLVERLIGAAPGAEMRLTMFVGVVAGTVIQTLGQNLSVELADMVGRFLAYVQDLDPREQEMLGRFLDSALGEAV